MKHSGYQLIRRIDVYLLTASRAPRPRVLKPLETLLDCEQQGDHAVTSRRRRDMDRASLSILPSLATNSAGVLGDAAEGGTSSAASGAM